MGAGYLLIAFITFNTNLNLFWKGTQTSPLQRGENHKLQKNTLSGSNQISLGINLRYTCLDCSAYKITTGYKRHCSQSTISKYEYVLQLEYTRYSGLFKTHPVRDPWEV